MKLFFSLVTEILTLKIHTLNLNTNYYGRIENQAKQRRCA